MWKCVWRVGKVWKGCRGGGKKCWVGVGKGEVRVRRSVGRNVGKSGGVGKCGEKGGVTSWDPNSPDPKLPDPNSPDPNSPDPNSPHSNSPDPTPTLDGVAMGSLLGPALANIFVGYYEEKLFSEISKPAVYFRYVDDTFVIFQNEKESEEFLIRLNSLHSSL